MSDRTLLGARIPTELKELVDADRRPNQKVVEAALWREFGGERKGPLQRRVEEKKRRVSMIESEKNERERELEKAEQELKALQSKLQQVEGKDERKERKAMEKVKGAPADPDLACVQVAAEMLSITPEEMAEKMEAER